MKKKISLLLCVLAAILGFTGCESSQKTESDYDKATLEQVTDFLIDYCAAADDATIEQWNSLSDFAMEQQLVGAGLPYTPESFRGAMEAWQAGVKECGAYESHGDYVFEETKTQVKVTAAAKFADRDADFTFLFAKDLRGNLALDSMTVAGHYSSGEILEKAGMNTLLGMGTVFCVLIFISLLISLFRFIPNLQKAFSKKPKQTETLQDASAGAAGKSAVAQTPEDSELAAVISAAIAAADEQIAADGFVVRSIRRRTSNKWS